MENKQSNEQYPLTEIVTDEQTKKMTLVDGEYALSEASGILLTMIDGAISFCNIKQLCEWERNHNTDLSYYKSKISELASRKMKVNEYMNKPELKEQKLEINVFLTIKEAQ